MAFPYTIDVFSLLNDVHATWSVTSVRVTSIWEDVREQKLFIFLHDQTKTQMVACVHHISLIPRYIQMNLVGGVFQMNRFRLGYNLNDWRCEGYGFASGEWTILIEPYTIFIPLMMDVHFGFPIYPLVHSIRTLCGDRSRRRFMIDVVGKIIRGRRVRSFRYHGYLRFGCFKIFIQDEPGNIIKMKLFDSASYNFMDISRAIVNRSIIYASRVKLVHLRANNVLNSTELTTIVVEPLMPEADAVRIRLT